MPGLSRASPCCPSRPRAAARPGSTLHLQDMKPTCLLDRRDLLSERSHWPYVIKRKALGLLVFCESRRQFSKSFTCGAQRTSLQLSKPFHWPLHSQDTLRYGNMSGLRQSAEMLHRNCRNPPQAQTSENTCRWNKPRRSRRSSAANSSSECCSAEG